MKDKYKILIIIGIITILLIILIILLLESNNNKCTRKVQAKLNCPSGYTDYDQNTKCINLSERYEINEDDTCPNGYGYLTLISLFGPNSYMCHPSKDYIYACDEGILIYNECIITINAIEK